MDETTSRVKHKGFTTEQRCTCGGYANAAIVKAIITNGHRVFSMDWYGLQSVFMQKWRATLWECRTPTCVLGKTKMLRKRLAGDGEL